MPDFYQTLFTRRDVRGEFKPDPVPDDKLARILIAAHHAPSVGLSQPWNFIVVRSDSTKQLVQEAFLEANEAEALQFDGERQRQYRGLKLQGIVDAPINICVTCDQRKGEEATLGATQQSDMDAYSTVCAVQNLWLAARAEGLGMGWVSIVQRPALQKIFNLPDGVLPVAYLCLGYVDYFFDKPELESRGWKQRTPLEGVVFNEQWQERDENDGLFKSLQEQAEWPQEYSSESFSNPHPDEL